MLALVTLGAQRIRQQRNNFEPNSVNKKKVTLGLHTKKGIPCYRLIDAKTPCSVLPHTHTRLCSQDLTVGTLAAVTMPWVTLVLNKHVGDIPPRHDCKFKIRAISNTKKKITMIFIHCMTYRQRDGCLHIPPDSHTLNNLSNFHCTVIGEAVLYIQNSCMMSSLG